MYSDWSRTIGGYKITTTSGGTRLSWYGGDRYHRRRWCSDNHSLLLLSLRRVVRLAGVGHVRHIAAVRRDAVVDSLNAAVGKGDGIGAGGEVAVALFAHVEAGAGEAVGDGVQVAIGGG